MKETPVSKFALCAVGLWSLAAPVQAQFKLQTSFEDTSAPGCSLSDAAVLTAPSIDPAGFGWLRLTDAASTQKGLALNNGFSFAGSQPVVVQFSYVSWGGTGADGIAVFLYDPSTPSPMAGALTGGGLGYCGGAGGYLAVGLDEYGNFSNPADKCGAASGGPGFTPEALVIRGPQSSSDAWVSTTAISGRIDNPGATSRPSPKTVLLSLTPAVMPAVGYTITAQFQSAAGQPFQTLFSNVPFPYAAPANLSVGFSGSTGGSTNVHELQGLTAASPDDLAVTMSGPSAVLQGSTVSYTVTLTNNGNYTLDGTNAPALTDAFPAAITAAYWTCAGSAGANCDPSGSGNLNTASMSLPPNGAVTYTVSGTLDQNATCGSTLANSSVAQFGSSTSFLDPDETNNSATVNSVVTCVSTLVANPGSLAFPLQQEGIASTSQTVTLTEGNNGSAGITGIVATGDYSQTNNCPATLPAGQSCNVSVVFTPSATGSSNGTLTIQSHLAGAPSVSAVVNLSGTGINSVPSAFSFTPLTNVAPSSVQTSNAITVLSTDVPAPISISAGGLYSINGAPYTSVAGVVSPGAQVQVQLTAAAGYSTSDSASLTIGGVSSIFTVTTGVQPVLQGGFSALTGVVAGSIQTSNPIIVSGTTLAVPITISSDAQYSINGGPYTSAQGLVQPGDTVTVQLSAPTSYNTTASAALTVGGVTTNFSITTATQQIPQAGFTSVAGAGLLSMQISNPITITSVTAPSSISVSDGAKYSINGGAFTATAGTVRPGDQVRIEGIAAATYGTTITVALTVGSNTSEFSVTTGEQPALSGGFTSTSNAAPLSMQVSNTVTITGITSPAAISITSGAEYSINGGPFTSSPGTVQAGDQLRVSMTAPSTYSTTTEAVLSINGLTVRYAVTTALAPLDGVAVTGGGGALGGTVLLALGLLACLKVLGARRATVLMPLAAALLGAFACDPARADEEPWWRDIYGGARVGASTSSMTAGKLARELRADGFQTTAAGAERGTASGTLYMGYELTPRLGVEVAGTYIGRTRAALQGVPPAELQALLADTARIVRGSGDIVALEARYRLPLVTAVSLDLRAGPYYWLTTSDIYVSGANQLHRSDRGVGYTLGLAPRLRVGSHVGLGVSIDYLNSTVQSQFWQFAATIEYHL